MMFADHNVPIPSCSSRDLFGASFGPMNGVMVAWRGSQAS